MCLYLLSAMAAINHGADECARMRLMVCSFFKTGFTATGRRVTFIAARSMLQMHNFSIYGGIIREQRYISGARKTINNH